MEIKTVDIAALKSPELNPRRHSEKQIDEMAKSVEKFGQIRPIVVDENNVVWCGNGLVESLKKLGRDKADAMVVSGLSESDKKKLMLADNKVFQLGFDDGAAVEQILLELDDFEIPGFDANTLEMLYGDLDDSISEFMDYGKATASELQTIEKKHEEFKQQQDNAVELAVVREVDADTGDERVAIRSDKEEPTAQVGRYITCPRCGEHIWL